MQLRDERVGCDDQPGDVSGDQPARESASDWVTVFVEFDYRHFSLPLFTRKRILTALRRVVQNFLILGQTNREGEPCPILGSAALFCG